MGGVMGGKLVFKGTAIVPGQAHGAALVAHEPVSFLGMVNTETGGFDCPGHELEGKSIAGKILIYPFGKGSSGDCIRMWRLDKFNVAPAGIIFQRAEPIHVQGALLLGVPAACGFEKDILAAVLIGDRVTIRDGVVTVERD